VLRLQSGRQQLSRSKQSGLHHRNAALYRACYFYFAEFLKVPEDEDLPVDRRKLRNSASHLLRCFLSLKGLIRRFERGSVGVQVPERWAHGGFALSAVELHYFVHCDPSDPGPKAAFGPEAGEMTPSLQKDFLNKIVLVRRIEGHRPDPPSHC